MKAPLARYMQSATPDFAMLSQAPLPLLALFDERARQAPDAQRLTPGERHWLPRSATVLDAGAARQYLAAGDERLLARFAAQPAAELVLLRSALVECRTRLPEGMLRESLATLARLAGAHLPPSAAVAMWQGLAPAPCEARLSTSDRRWLRFHRAVAAGRASEMADAAQAILEAEAALPPELLAHALSAFMAGKILMKDGAEALSAFARHRGNLTEMAPEWKPVFRFLVAHAERLRRDS
jgi:hypothetical protein